jgi:predicted RNA-binding Zn ribbon-like protein
LSTPFAGATKVVTAAPAPDRAPGTLDLIRVFENTVELPDGPDELEGLEPARKWCRRHHLAPVAGAQELQRLRDFREALRELLFLNNEGGDAQTAWDGLTPFLQTARLGMRVDSSRGLELQPAEAESEGAIASLLAIVYEALHNGTWSRLRACRKAACRFAYYDQTKNGSRAWCSMATCGNQAKAQRRRERERSIRS